MEADGAAPPPPPPMDSTSIEGAESVDSSSSSSEEEYDINDLNEDGVVTIDELRQAFASGDDSLSELFEGAEAEGYSTLMRMAMKAYQTQTGEVYSAMSETIA